MMAISAYIPLGILANTKIGKLMFEHEGRQLRLREMKYKHIAQMLNTVQTNRRHCL